MSNHTILSSVEDFLKQPLASFINGRMKESKETIDVDRAELALKRAINRIDVSKREEK